MNKNLQIIILLLSIFMIFSSCDSSEETKGVIGEVTNILLSERVVSKDEDFLVEVEVEFLRDFLDEATGRISLQVVVELPSGIEYLDASSFLSSRSVLGELGDALIIRDPDDILECFNDKTLLFFNLDEADLGQAFRQDEQYVFIVFSAEATRDNFSTTILADASPLVDYSCVENLNDDSSAVIIVE